MDLERALATALPRLFDPLYIVILTMLVVGIAGNWRHLGSARKLGFVLMVLGSAACALLWDGGGVYGLLAGMALVFWLPSLVTRVARGLPEDSTWRTRLGASPIAASPRAREAAQATPWITYLLCAINVAIYLALVIPRGSFDPDVRDLIAAGALRTEPLSWDMAWRLLAFNFLHASPAHIAFNLLALNSLGPPLERALGRWRFLLIYLSIGVMAGLVVLYLPGFSLRSLLALFIGDGRAIRAGAITVGASGCVMGLVGLRLALSAMARRGYRAPAVPGDSPGAFGSIIINQAIMDTLVPGLSMIGHLAGAAAGALIGLLLAVFTSRVEPPSAFPPGFPMRRD